MARPSAVVALVFCLGLAVTGRFARADDEFDGATVIFVRGSSLFQVDAKGKAEAAIAQLPAKVTVRALRSDAGGTVLLADLAGQWAWMPLDGQAKSLTELPCADGPAQLAEDGTSVLCRSPRSANRSILVDLPHGAHAGKPGKTVAVDIPPASARLVGSGAERMLVWADATGVWTAPPGDLKAKTRVAPDPPLRGFLASPDGERAIGVYADQVFADARHTKPAEVLMTLQLDNQGARRKAIRDGVAIEWSHDAQWVLVQDGASACIMRASGGQYKCWRGFTAQSLSGDGRWGLALGNRDGSKKQTPPKPVARPAAKPSNAKPSNAKQAKPAEPAGSAGPPGPPGPPGAPGPDDKPWDSSDEPSDEPEAAEAPPANPSGKSPNGSRVPHREAGSDREAGAVTEGDWHRENDDVSIAPPSGLLSLYRLRLEGAFTDRPTLLVKVVDGAAVWVPKPP